MTRAQQIRRERIERIMRPIDADTIPSRRKRVLNTTPLDDDYRERFRSSLHIKRRIRHIRRVYLRDILYTHTNTNTSHTSYIYTYLEKSVLLVLCKGLCWWM